MGEVNVIPGPTNIGGAPRGCLRWVTLNAMTGFIYSNGAPRR